MLAAVGRSCGFDWTVAVRAELWVLGDGLDFDAEFRPGAVDDLAQDGPDLVLGYRRGLQSGEVFGQALDRFG
jgi:hypothetical protein